MDKLAWFAILSVAVLAIGVGALALRAPSLGAPGVDVTIAHYEFGPKTVTVPAGTTVRWTNMDHEGHTVTFGGHGDGDHGAGVDSGLMGHMRAFVHTFDEPGTYEYHCDPHPYMTGVVVVTP